MSQIGIGFAVFSDANAEYTQCFTQTKKEIRKSLLFFATQLKNRPRIISGG